MIFLIEPTGPVPPDVLLLADRDERAAEVFPPILDRVFADLAAGWPPGEPFLDNICVPRVNAGD